PFGGEKAVEGTLLREGLVKAPNLVPMAVALAAQLQAPRTPVTPAGVVGEGRGAQGRPLREALPLTVPDGLLEAPGEPRGVHPGGGFSQQGIGGKAVALAVQLAHQG